MEKPRHGFGFLGTYAQQKICTYTNKKWFYDLVVFK